MGIRVLLLSSLLMLLLQFPLGTEAWSANVTPAATRAPTPQASDAVSDAVEAQLKDAVLKTQSSLGQLSLQQKRIFDEEVLPDYPLFIKDYSRDGQTVHAQIDIESIRSITRFVAPLGSKILLYLSVDPHCEKCTTEAPPVRKMMEDRAVRRGFAPVWVAADELASASISELTGPPGTMGFLEVDLAPAPVDDDDPEHDVRYVAKTQLSVHGVASYQDQAEFFDTDSFDVESEKLLTHAFSDLGSKADLAGVSALSKDDLLVEVGKIAGFDEYRKLRDAIQSNLKGVALVEQRKLSRGKAVFALKTRKSLQEIGALLKDMQLDGQRKAVLVGSNAPSSSANASSNDPKIVMEIR